MLELGIRVTLSLAVVLGLLWATARLGARRMGGGSRSLVRVRGRQALSRTSSVAVVEVGNRVLVLGVADTGVRLLTELDPEDIEVPVGEETGDAGPARRTTLAVPGAHAGTTPAGLAGSLLSGTTWKQAWAAATSRQPRAAGPVIGETGE